MIEKLSQIVGKENIITDVHSLEPYSHDETPGFSVIPKVAVKPENTEQISEIMRFANENRIPVTPRGGGTGLSGGAVPSSDGIVISFERMNRIREIDTENLMAVVEPGVITAELAAEARKRDLLYAPDPASIDDCTIGGNIAECAGGMRTVKYGTTRDYVVGLEAVLPTGEIMRCGGKLVKNVTGYDLISLLTGSEGTLAIVTLATLRLLPLPTTRVSLFIPYSDIDQAARTVQQILDHRIIPSAIELMEHEAIKVAEEHLDRKLPFNVPQTYTCILLIEIDGKREDQVERDYNEIGDIALDTGALDVFVGKSPSDQNKLWQARRAVSEALKSRGGRVHQDIVVPPSQVPSFLRGIEKLKKKYGLRMVNYGHIGDGNVHVNILKENTPEDEWCEKIPRLVRDSFELGLSLGGMISGEHGIGLEKKPYLSMALSETHIQLMRQIKKVFDPNNILNPGKIF
jgi:glycolate oxidase